jgi:hypothetical protein
MGTPRQARRKTSRATGAPVSRGRLLAGATVACLVVAVYANALDNPFVYDDHDTIISNQSLVDPSNFRYVLIYSPFRPVVNASYAIDRAVWGYRPFGFHLTNVLLHAIVSVLLYALLLRALADARERSGALPRGDTVDIWAALTGASLFAVHPLMTEGAGYISGRSELLCGLFFLAALLFSREAMLRLASPTAQPPGRTGIALPLALAVVCGALALLSKEVAAALPVVALAYDWLLLPGPPEARRRRLVRVFIPAIVAAGLAAAYRLSVLVGADASFSRSPILNLLTQSIVIWRYVGLLVLPIGQSIMHGVHTVTSLLDPLGLAALGGLTGLAILAFGVRDTVPLVAFGILWFLTVIAPSSSVVALREGMAEHRAYFASAGVFVVVAALASRVLSRDGRTDVPAGYAAALGLVVVVLGSVTVARNRVWQDPVALWRQAAVAVPGMWEPHYVLGDSLREAGDCAAAIGEYQTVLEMRPDNRDARLNLGICLGQAGRLDEADAAFHEVLRADPRFPRVYTNLAALALVRGQPEGARDYYRQAIGVDPRNVLARLQLARLYEQTFHDYRTAAVLCDEVRVIAPATPGATDCVERNRKLAEAAGAGR